MTDGRKFNFQEFINQTQRVKILSAKRKLIQTSKCYHDHLPHVH